MRLSIGFLFIATVLIIGLVSVTPACVDAISLSFPGLTFGSSLAQVSDGSYVITGTTDPSDTAQYDVYLAKISTGGDTIWKKTYDQKGYDEGKSVLQTSDGGYIITGTRSPTKDKDYVLLLKTDANGNELWDKTYGRTGGDTGNHVTQTKDGGYVIIGEANSFKNSTRDDIYLVRTDANGSVIWDRTYGGALRGYGDSLVQTMDGGFAIIGPYNGSADMRLIKIDAEGNITWSKTYGKIYSDLGYSAIQASNGCYLIIGRTISFNTTHDSMYLIKTDSEGNMIWNKTYGGTDGNAIVRTSDGGYLLGGLKDRPGKDNGIDFYLVKTDADGNMIWNATYGDNDHDFLSSVAQTLDGNYVAFGDSSGNLKYRAYLVKIDQSGNLVWNRTYIERDFKYAALANSVVSIKSDPDLMVVSDIITLFILALIVTVGYILKRRHK